ncbi:MAG TPA: ATP-binding protein [Streptosporangiaceae bacterium]|nr:ATP-binding protein [Streptosporangiaceae bacterium]
MRETTPPAVAVSSAATAGIALFPQLYAGSWRSTLHVTLETATSLIALLAAFLAMGRLRRHTLLNEFMLTSALVVFALSSLFFVMLTLLDLPPPSGLTIEESLAGDVLGALLFALAALLPRRRLRQRGLVLAGGGAATAVALVFAAVLVDGLTARVPHRLAAALQAVPGPHAPPMLPAWQLATVVLYALAAIVFLVRFHQLGNEFLGWLAISAVLATAAHVDDFLYPVPGLASAYLGEALQLLFWAVILTGLMRATQSYWRAQPEAAVLEERRRVACDLHDGLSQELAYLARNLDLLDGETNAETVERLQHAVERAQVESRRTIRGLTAPGGQAFEIALADAAREIAERFRVGLEFNSTNDVKLSKPQAEAMMRIACEAVTNAARHSGASQVRVSLRQNRQHVHLLVSDAGCGFDPDADGAGFGLVSMRERARAACGDLRITSIPGHGSEVEVVL